MKPTFEKQSEERVFDNYFKVDKGSFKETDSEGKEVVYDRLKLTRPDAVAVIIYNADEDTVVLVKQHRYPTEGKVTGGRLFGMNSSGSWLLVSGNT